MFNSKNSKKRKLTLSKPWAKLFKAIAKSSKKSKKRKSWTKKVSAFGKSAKKKH